MLPLAFGGLTTSFSGYQTSASLDPAALAAFGPTLQAGVDKNLRLLFGLGAGVFVATFAFVSIFSLQAERVTNRIRVAYLSALLKQNIAYYDALSIGQVVSRPSLIIQCRC